MRTLTALTQREQHEAFRCGICFALCTILGSAGVVSATVPCDDLAQTNLELLSVKKAGVAQAFPSQLELIIHNNSPVAIVYDPDTGKTRLIPLEVSK